MKVSELKKLLKKNGCYKVREGGNHEIWYSPKTGQTFAVPRHNAREVPAGTLNSIRGLAGI
ncbi:MAG: type II toxin-antitoxin system HicA family toxin [Clostridiales bacterium]|nr:type II toxin-antitoxin system HicA family toxin [Clostridiales bacterium]